MMRYSPLALIGVLPSFTRNAQVVAFQTQSSSFPALQKTVHATSWKPQSARSLIASNRRSTSLSVTDDEEGFLSKLPNPFGLLKKGGGSDTADNTEDSSGSDSSVDIDSPLGLVRQARRCLASDYGILDPSLLDDARFCWIGPFVDQPLTKVEYLAAGRFFDLRAAFPDLDYRPHDFRIDQDDPNTVRLTCRITGTMRGSLRLRTGILPPTGDVMKCPPEAVSMTFDADTGKLVKLCTGFAMDRQVGNTRGATGVMAASMIAGEAPSDWDLYPAPSVIARFFGRPIKPIAESKSVLAPFPENVMIQLAKGILATNMATNDDSLLSDKFEFCTPYIGPVRKAKFLEKYARQEFAGVDPSFSHFRVDPYDPVRVWVDVLPRGQMPNDKGVVYQGAPQAMSFAFDEDGFCTRITSSYVMDPSIGNGGGLGGPEGYLYSMGKASPSILTRPYARVVGRLRKAILSPITGVGVDDYVSESPRFERKKATPPAPAPSSDTVPDKLSSPVEKLSSIRSLNARMSEPTIITRTAPPTPILTPPAPKAAPKPKPAPVAKKAPAPKAVTAPKPAPKGKSAEQIAAERAEAQRQKEAQLAQAKRQKEAQLAQAKREREAQREQAKREREAALEQQRQQQAADRAAAERKRKEAAAVAEKARAEANAKAEAARKKAQEQAKARAAAQAEAKLRRMEQQRLEAERQLKEAQARRKAAAADKKKTTAPSVPRPAPVPVRGSTPPSPTAKQTEAEEAARAKAKRERQKAALDRLSSSVKRASISLFGLGGEQQEEATRTTSPQISRSSNVKKSSAPKKTTTSSPAASQPRPSISLFGLGGESSADGTQKSPSTPVKRATKSAPAKPPAPSPSPTLSIFGSFGGGAAPAKKVPAKKAPVKAPAKPPAPAPSPTLSIFGGFGGSTGTQTVAKKPTASKTSTKPPASAPSRTLSIFGGFSGASTDTKAAPPEPKRQRKVQAKKTTPQQKKAPVPKPAPVQKKEAVVKKTAPRGVPTISRWSKNRDGSVTGIISGSPNFRPGEKVTTSPIVNGKVQVGEVVRTGSGSRYFLG